MMRHLRAARSHTAHRRIPRLSPPNLLPALVAALGFLLLATAPSAQAYKWVVLDPGHGGKDNGAYWSGVREKTLNLDLARRVQAILKSKGVPAVLTRTSDVYVSLDQRAAIANKYSDHLFVSLHFNASLNRSVTGIESFYYSSNGRKLASAIQSSLASRIRTKNRGLKKRSYKVLMKTKGTAALVECGFISNAWERKRCNSDWFRQILAEQIAKGIVNFM